MSTSEIMGHKASTMYEYEDTTLDKKYLLHPCRFCGEMPVHVETDCVQSLVCANNAIDAEHVKNSVEVTGVWRYHDEYQELMELLVGRWNRANDPETIFIPISQDALVDIIVDSLDDTLCDLHTGVCWDVVADSFERNEPEGGFYDFLYLTLCRRLSTGETVYKKVWLRSLFSDFIPSNGMSWEEYKIYVNQ